MKQNKRGGIWLRPCVLFILMLLLMLCAACGQPHQEGEQNPAGSNSMLPTVSESTGSGQLAPLQSDQDLLPQTESVQPSGTQEGESQQEASQAPSSQQEQQKTFPMQWLLVAAAALLALALVMMLVLKRKSAKTDGAAGKSQTTETAPIKEESRVIRTQRDGGLSVMIGNAHNIGSRENQQDSFAISDVTNQALCMDRGIFAVVADGMGGLANGAQVSSLVTSTMLRQFESGPMGSDPSLELLNMVTHANQEVNRYLSAGSKEQSGSTVVAILLKHKELHFISVGDSRIYLIRGEGLTQLNREHTYASELDEKAARGEISLEQARSDPQRRALTSYIGMQELSKIDRSIRPLTLQKGDRILLMSDGVFGTISEEEIWQAAQTDAGQAADNIERLVLEKRKRGQDNFTMVILQCV